jgi:hypothetical protein
MDEPSVMATENALMAAALTPGSTVIHNAASEPHVQDLARLLMAMGARIEGIGSNLMIVHGQEELAGADYAIGPDYIEIGSFIALAACTGGELRIRDTNPSDLRMTRLAFERLGCRIEFDGNDVVVPGGQRLRIKSDEGDAISKIEDGPWPAFPADLTSIAVAMATQAEGLILIHEKMFENRLYFVDKLVTMGARVIVCDPHRAVVSGPSRLHGERMESPDIRAGMAILIAALCADGESEIGNIRQIDRGYERIDERLRLLGARIERVATERVPPNLRERFMTHPIPPGTRDVLPEEMRELRAIGDRMRQAFEDAGYGEIHTPALEYEEVLLRGDERAAGARYRSFDENGAVLALRSDMTIPIARVVATRYAEAEPPLRFSYVARAWRATDRGVGEPREFLQAGLELIGVPGAEGEAEVIALTIEALTAAGLGRHRVGVGDGALYRTLLASFGVPDDAHLPMLEALSRRDLVGAEHQVTRWA